jgi:hypothetical protein
MAKMRKGYHQKVEKILPALQHKYCSIGRIRAEIKRHLQKELKEIDKLTLLTLRP